jgi:hypothetical protein
MLFAGDPIDQSMAMKAPVAADFLGGDLAQLRQFVDRRMGIRSGTVELKRSMGHMGSLPSTSQGPNHPARRTGIGMLGIRMLGTRVP